MQLSCLPVSFFNEIRTGEMSIGEWARMGAGLGLEGIDLSIAWLPDHSPAALAQLRREIEDAGLSVVMVCTYPDFTHPDAAQRAHELAQEQEAVAVAAALGARLVRVTAGQAHPETERAAGIAWAAEGMRCLAEATHGSGVTLVYENHAKPFVWQYTDFSQPPDVFLEIVRATAGSELGVNFDTANATAFGEDPVALLRQVVGRVVSVHASDTAVRGALQMVLLGTGIVPYAALFAELKRAGFDGWICMEEGSKRGVEGIAAAARFVRTAWQSA